MSEKSPASVFLENRRNFINLSSTCFTVLLALLMLWQLGSEAGLVGSLVIVVGSIVVGRVWAVFVWFAFRSIFDIDDSKVGREEE